MSDDVDTILQALSLKINCHLQHIRSLNQENGEFVWDNFFLN